MWVQHPTNAWDLGHALPGTWGTRFLDPGVLVAVVGIRQNLSLSILLSFLRFRIPPLPSEQNYILYLLCFS